MYILCEIPYVDDKFPYWCYDEPSKDVPDVVWKDLGSKSEISFLSNGKFWLLLSAENEKIGIVSANNFIKGFKACHEFHELGVFRKDNTTISLN